MVIDMTQNYAIIADAEPNAYYYHVLATQDRPATPHQLAAYGRKWYNVRCCDIRTDHIQPDNPQRVIIT